MGRCRASRARAQPKDFSQEIAVPALLKAEHDELHAELAAAAKLSDPVGVAAREVAKLLHPHFVKEKQFALPPLGLLSAMASGNTVSGMEAVIAMTDRLKEGLPTMLAEHIAILDALEKLVDVARAVGGEAQVHFAGKLTRTRASRRR